MSGYQRSDLLAPGTLVRPDHISERDWERMPWSARWRVTRTLVASATRVARCGTVDGYGRHLAENSAVCVACHEAVRAERRTRRAAIAAARAAGRIAHGTASGYKDGCRCPECRAYNRGAVRAWRAKKADERALVDVIDIVSPRAPGASCGTRSGYKRHLRHDETPCGPCKAAHSEYTSRKKRERRRAAS